MVPDSYGKLHPRLMREEHVSVTEEPFGRYLWHFVPEDPVPPEKPAFKVAQALYDLLKTYDSTDSLIVLQGDSTRANTGWKGDTHAHLEKMLGRKLFWSIWGLHTNELPLRHLITSIDGPTSSDTGFTGPVCSLLSSVNEMQYNAEFRGVPGGEDLTEIPEYILVNMSTDQQVSPAVQAVKRAFPSELRDKCARSKGLFHLRHFKNQFTEPKSSGVPFAHENWVRGKARSDSAKTCELSLLTLRGKITIFVDIFSLADQLLVNQSIIGGIRRGARRLAHPTTPLPGVTTREWILETKSVSLPEPVSPFLEVASTMSLTAAMMYMFLALGVFSVNHDDVSG
ncbi:hypothetical protein GWK47_036267 [Chionoecetes opilio]|uniref:Uncharacterized protein n=1 Tax=Chionoecetes opilio TaxID=41210 RepID=A0A8J4YED8_CHIOP|nr:hypothetical protein GWK47_036267 [Chionoecetes opilio]